MDQASAGVNLIIRQAVLSHHHNSTGFRGVSFDQSRGKKWRAEIQPRRGKRKRSKRFATVEEAAAAYDSLAKDAYGDIAALNFPLKDEKKTIFRQGRECGHAEAQLYVSPNGQVNCKECVRASGARYRERLFIKLGRKTLNKRESNHRPEWRRCKEFVELGKAILAARKAAHSKSRQERRMSNISSSVFKRKLPPPPRMQIYNLKLPPDEIARLKALARHRGVLPSALAREAILTLLRQYSRR